jgi:hypothetical protein
MSSCTADEAGGEGKHVMTCSTRWARSTQLLAEFAPALDKCFHCCFIEIEHGEFEASIK